MTIKTHIIISATITLSLIAVIACQNKIQAPENKEKDKAIPNVSTVIEKSTKEAKNITEEVKKAVDEGKSKINEEFQKAEEVVEEAKETAEAKLEDTDQETKFESKNLLLNCDFSDGLNNWNCDNEVKIVQMDGKVSLELIAPEKGQTRAWQSINTTSGHVYRLTFKSKCDQIQSFAIFRDHKSNKEEYLFTNPSETWKEYQKDFVSYKDGSYRVYLSCKGKGQFYYSDISLIDLNNK